MSSPVSTDDILEALASGKFRPMTFDDLEGFAGIEYEGHIWDSCDKDCEADCIVILDRASETLFVQVISTSPEKDGVWVLEIKPDRNEPELI